MLSQRNGLDYLTLPVITSRSIMPSLFNILNINLALEADEKCLYAYYEILHKTSASDEILNMLHATSTKIDFSIWTLYKITKSAPSSSKISKTGHLTVLSTLKPLANNPIKRLLTHIPTKPIYVNDNIEAKPARVIVKK